MSGRDRESADDRYVSKFDQFAMDCQATQFIKMIGGRWKIQIIWTLREGTFRFAALNRLLPGVTQAMLAQQLRELEQDGLIERKVWPVIPAHVDYSLSNQGHSLLGVLFQINGWMLDHRSRPETVEAE